MTGALVDPVPADPRVPAASGPLPFGDVPGGRHLEVGDDGLDAAGVEALFTDVDEVVFTPWKGVFIPAAAQA